jgi:hypothetical protein
MSFLQNLFGSPAKQGSTFNKGQLSLIDQIIQQVKGMGQQGQGNIENNQNFNEGQDWLHSLFNDPDFFKNFEAPALRQFEEEIAPGIANRYASMGSGGSTGSTGFRNALAREGSNLSQNLASQRYGMQQQGVNQSLQYGQQPFQNYMQLQQQALQPTQNTFSPATQGLIGPLLGSAAGAMSAGYGQGLGQKFAGQFNSTY